MQEVEIRYAHCRTNDNTINNDTNITYACIKPYQLWSFCAVRAFRIALKEVIKFWTFDCNVQKQRLSACRNGTNGQETVRWLRPSLVHLISLLLHFGKDVIFEMSNLHVIWLTQEESSREMLNFFEK